MTPIHSVAEGLALASAHLANPAPSVTVIPDGVGLMAAN